MFVLRCRAGFIGVAEITSDQAHVLRDSALDPLDALRYLKLDEWTEHDVA